MADSNSVLRSVVIVDGIPNTAIQYSMNVMATASAAIFQMGKVSCHQAHTVNTCKEVEETTQFRKGSENIDMDVIKTTVEHSEGNEEF